MMMSEASDQLCFSIIQAMQFSVRIDYIFYGCSLGLYGKCLANGSTPPPQVRKYTLNRLYIP